MNKSTKLALINSAIAGGIAWISAVLAVKEITLDGMVFALATGILIFLIKCRDYFGKIKSKKAIKGGWFEFI